MPDILMLDKWVSKRMGESYDNINQCRYYQPF